MNQQQPENKGDALTQAQETIAHQAREVASLRKQLEREHFAQELARLLSTATTMNIVLSPFTHSRLLEIVVSMSAQVISARSGSLFLIDEEANDLVFEVAIGPAAQEVKKFRVPLGVGIAGIVALTGQSMAIADAQQDERFAVDIATAVNYLPQNILCVPLFYDDRVIGAIELLDKIGAPSFTPTDIELLGQFANMAAVAIAQSQAYHDQRTVLTTLLHQFEEMSGGYAQNLHHHAIAFSNWIQMENPINTSARELAMLVHELIESGEQESELCKNILQGVVTSIHRRRRDPEAMAGVL